MKKLMFNQQLNKIIFEQFYQLSDQHLYHLMNIFKNENMFKRYLKIDNTESEMFQGILEMYQTGNKEEAIKNMLIWKTLTLKTPVYIPLNISNQKENYDYSIDIWFDIYNMKSGKIQQQMFQIYGQTKAIFYSMIKQKQPLQYIYNYIKKEGHRLM